MKRKGFTLIELLVVIAIIGLLSTLAVVSLNGARAKARDAQRISDVKQLSTIIEIEATENSTAALETCTGVRALVNSCSGPGDFEQGTIGNLKDPQNPTDPCHTTSAAACLYTIALEGGAAGATVGNYDLEGESR